MEAARHELASEEVLVFTLTVRRLYKLDQALQYPQK